MERLPGEDRIDRCVRQRHALRRRDLGADPRQPDGKQLRHLGVRLLEGDHLQRALAQRRREPPGPGADVDGGGDRRRTDRLVDGRSGVTRPEPVVDHGARAKGATQTDGDGNVTTYVRNANGEVTHQETRSSTGTLVSADNATFDLADNETSVTDGAGNTTYYTYNADGKVTHQETRSAAGVLVDESDSTYDKAGYLATQTDGDGNVTTYTRNAAGEVLHQETRTSTGVLVSQQSSTFDLADQQTSQTDGDGNVTSYSYNASGQVTQQETWSTGGVLAFRMTPPTIRPTNCSPRPTATAM